MVVEESSLVRISKKQEEVQELHQEGNRDVEGSLRFGRTPLHEAILMNDLETIRSLLNENKYLMSRDNNGHTPLDLARLEENIVVIKMIMEFS
jgi:ankyrin repeat protein